MRARFILTVLCSFVAFFAEAPNLLANTLWAVGEHPECRALRGAKYVSVVNTPEEIDGLLLGDDSRSMIIVQWQGLFPDKIGISGEKHRSGVVGLGLFSNEFRTRLVFFPLAFGPDRNSMGRGLSKVLHFYFELYRSCERILKAGTGNSDVGPQLALGSIFNNAGSASTSARAIPCGTRTIQCRVYHLECRRDIFIHGSSDILHSVSGALSLSNGLCHLRRLALVNKFHSVDGFFQSASLNPKDSRLTHPNEKQQARKPHQPSIGVGFILTLLGVLGGFFVALRGGYYLNEKRMILGTTLTVIGAGGVIGGYLLWMIWPI